MQKSLRARIGATLATAALVAGGVLFSSTAASAQAEPPVPTLTSSTTTFAAGNWAAGITAEVTGFPANTLVTVSVGVGSRTAQSGEGWGETTLTTDANGAGTVTGWIPTAGPTEFDPATEISLITAYSGDLEVPESVIFVQGPELTITPFVANAPSMTITPICISPEAVSTDGYQVDATGFNPFESVSDSVVGPDGVQIGETATLTADASGTVSGKFSLSYTVNGVPTAVPAGIYTEYLSSAYLPLEASFTVGDCATPAAAPEVAAPQLANTGSELTTTFAGAGAILALGAIALFMVRRRQVAAE